MNEPHQIGSRHTGAVRVFACVVFLVVGSHLAAAADSIRTRAARSARESYRAVKSIALSEYPIGVFDSGTGGLAVLEAILTLDTFDNTRGNPAPQGDGKPDLAEESFVFLADQANMPYGNYAGLGKQAYLEDLIVKDAEFLLSDQYFPNAESDPVRGKAPVKAIVIACNTATAYGKDDIERLLADAGLGIPVVGVVDAAARGALDAFAEGQGGAVGVLATRGTVLSGAYPRAIQAEAARRKWSQTIHVVQQGSLGLAGAIDGSREFIVPPSVSPGPRDDYQGPSLSRSVAGIDGSILPRYAFDFSEGRMLFEGSPSEPAVLQLNSVENYLRYDLVSLLESLRNSPRPEPLRAIILGCTHFPYYAETFRRELRRLRDYREDGVSVYGDCLASSIELIDPARLTARELYQCLAKNNTFDLTAEDPLSPTRGEFFITVPCRPAPGVELTPEGQFTYVYKYGRDRENVGADYRAVPLRPEDLDLETAGRLRKQLPLVWELMSEFSGCDR